MSTILPTHGVALVQIQDAGLKHAAHVPLKIQDAKIVKNSPSAHHRTTLSGYIFTTNTCIENRKKNLLNSNTSPTCPYNMVNFGPLTAEICWRVRGTPANFNRFRVLASLLQCSALLARGQPNFARCLAVSWAGALCVHFEGSCPLMEFCQLQNSLWVQVLHSSILALWLHGIRAAAIRQALWRGTRNGIAELTQRVPPIFGWAAIALGISYFLLFVVIIISTTTTIVILNV